MSQKKIKTKKIKTEIDWNPVIAELPTVIAKLVTLTKWIMLEIATVKVVKIVCDLIINLN